MKNKFTGVIRFLLPVSLLMAGTRLLAQPFNLTESVQPTELIFTDYIKTGETKPDGRISLNPLTQDVDTSYYFIKGLSMYAPTYFSLNSTDPAADIKINLCKENWHVVHHTGNVNGKGIWSCKFKTEGDFGIMVIANKKPVRYVLLVWSGNDLKVEIPSVFKTATEDDMKGGSWFKRHMMWLIGGALVLILIAFILIKPKNKRS